MGNLNYVLSFQLKKGNQAFFTFRMPNSYFIAATDKSMNRVGCMLTSGVPGSDDLGSKHKKATSREMRDFEKGI
jgi:hypothetical protein